MTHQIDREAAREKLGGAKLAGVLAADLRVVSLDFVKGAPVEHIVLADELDMFIEACVRLHFNPGINPGNGCETSRIWRLRVSELAAYGPYWWAMPSLGECPSRAGAMTIHGSVGRTVWRDEKYEAAV